MRCRQTDILSVLFFFNCELLTDPIFSLQGLLLGLPCGSADLEFEPEETFSNPNIDIDDLFNKKLCNIVGRVMERNQSEQSQVYGITHNIDEMLNQLYNGMPEGWWEIPTFIPNDGSVEAVQIFNRLMSEMCQSTLSLNLLLDVGHEPLPLRITATLQKFRVDFFHSRSMIHVVSSMTSASVPIKQC
jgi:hypothetical protein